MAYEIWSSQSVWTSGACGGGSAGGIVAKKSSSAVADCFSARKSWSPPTHVDFGAGKSPQKGFPGSPSPQLLRHTALRARASADTAQQDKFGFLGPLKCIEGGSPEQPCARQSAGPGNSPLEQWLENYVTEIVRHLPEAPFLQYVPKYNNSYGERRRVSEELFENPENWQSAKHCLLESAPDGIILVHRLDHQSLSECCVNEVNATGVASRSSTISLEGDDYSADGSSTDVWGVLVQARNTRRHACYLLKTTRVASATGILTYFCLSPAKCFGPSLRFQLQSTWLL